MEQLLKDAERIKSLEIQGATNVALSAIDFLSNYAKRLKCRDIESCIDNLYKAREILMDTRPTEPAMKNGLKFLMSKLEKEKENCCLEDIPDIIEKYKNQYNEMLQESKKKIADIGARRFPETKKKFIVMTHCHSTLVTAILLEAKRQGKNFQRFHNKHHRYSCLKGKTPMEVIQEDNYKPITLGPNTKLPQLDYIPDGNITLIRFIRSDRKLDIFGEKFEVSKDLVYSYVKAVILTEIHVLQVYFGNELAETFDYRLTA